MTLVLGLDCSGESYSVGLWSRSGVRLEVSGYQPRRALCEMSSAITHLLKTAGVRAQELDCVGVTSGPGSFTGVRLGVTVARTVAMVAGCPICPWDTLLVLAAQVLPPQSRGQVAVALDARRRELYCGLFRNEPSGVVAVLQTGVRTPADYAERLSEFGTWHAAVGTGFAAYPELLAEQWPGPRLTSRRDSAPSGLVIARLSADRPDLWCCAQEVVPAYHRRADIQVQPGLG